MVGYCSRLLGWCSRTKDRRLTATDGILSFNPMVVTACARVVLVARPRSINLAAEAAATKLENLLRLSFIQNPEIIPWQKTPGLDTLGDPCRFHDAVPPKLLAFFRCQRAGNDVCSGGFPIEILKEPTTVTNDQTVEILQGRLSVTIDMGNYSTEDGRTVAGRSPDLCIQVLQFDLFPAHIVPKPTKAGGIVFLPGFVVEVIYKMWSDIARYANDLNVRVSMRLRTDWEFASRREPMLDQQDHHIEATTREVEGMKSFESRVRRQNGGDPGRWMGR